jgi:hypothetical protein
MSTTPNNKFSVTIPATDTLKVYGYRNLKTNTVYWLDGQGIVRFFCPTEGTSGSAYENDFMRYDRNPDLYEPIYEPFSINIGA